MPSSPSYRQRAPGAPDLPDTPLRFILYFLYRNRWWYGGMVLLESLHAGCGILLPYAISEIVRGVTKAAVPSAAVIQALYAPVMLFALLSTGEVLFARAGGALQITLGPRQRQTVTRALYAYLQQHSHRYFSNNFAGALAHRIAETAFGVNQTLWAIIFDFWPVAIVFTVSISLLAHAHASLALFVGIWAVLFVGVSYGLARLCRPYAFKAANARSDTTGRLVDSVTNLSSTRLFSRLDFERHYLDGCLKRELVHVDASNWFAERVRWFQFVAAAILKIGTLWYALRLWAQGQIGVAEFVMATSLSLLIISEARNLSRRFLEFFEFIGNVSNGVHSIVQDHEVVDPPDAGTLAVRYGAIAFQDVCFGYSPGEPLFKSLSLSIPAGQRVGLVGLSGSGKSSFVNLILRLYDIQGGRISIDGVDIRSVTQDALHSQIGVIPQDPSLFHRSLLENIRYARPEATDAEVEAAARQAWAHDFVVDMAEGYQSMVGERGVKLSGGQRQRIAIARVMLKNAPILILDEATSSLDSITERAIQNTLETAMHGKTVIVVAHRLSTIAQLDRILVFENGSIIEDGAHAQLLARQGAYWRLWAEQQDGFLPKGGRLTGTAAVVESGDTDWETDLAVVKLDRERESQDRADRDALVEASPA